MESGKGTLRLSLSYEGMTTTFEGTPEEVLRSVISFMEKNVTAFSIAKRLVANVDLQELTSSLSEFIGFNNNEGFFFKQKFYSLPVNEQISIFFAKRYLEHYLGRAPSNTSSFKEVVSSLSLKKGTASSALNDLLRKGLVRRHEKGDYSVTLNGLLSITSKYGGRGGERLQT
ncbi:MAG: MarR family transcriptional regulator [Aigarchaeota archaeon]|nr:MarR family transcriptional regulator [Aigarchaeota archaeon]MDW8093024.1 helix-turn-helix domain-containing protein [Nitrososphaerota archaeon]